MTAIAYRDGIMAADTGVFNGCAKMGHTRKIIRAGDGTLAGACGSSGICARFLEWVRDGQGGKFSPPESEDGFCGLLVQPGGAVYLVDEKGLRTRTEAPFHALGSANEVLLGAMAAGAPSRQAVEIAIEWHVYASGSVQVEYLNPPPT